MEAGPTLATATFHDIEYLPTNRPITFSLGSAVQRLAGAIWDNALYATRSAQDKTSELAIMGSVTRLLTCEFLVVLCVGRGSRANSAMDLEALIAEGRRYGRIK